MNRYSYKLYDKLNRWAFRCFLKTGNVLAEVMSVGKLFQRHGAATPKARSPAVDRRDRRTISLFEAADLSRVLEQWRSEGGAGGAGRTGRHLLGAAKGRKFICVCVQ